MNDWVRLAAGLAVALALAFPGTGFSAEPRARIELEPAESTVGSAVQMRVTVLVPTYFTSPPVYPSFELANLVVRLPPNSNFNLNEQIDGENYTGIARDYEVYAQRPGRFEFDGLRIAVSYADADTRQPISASVPLEAISLEATVPPGAEDLEPFVAAAKLSLRQQVSGIESELEPGAAITRNLTIEAEALPAMLLPPLVNAASPDGLRAYPAIAKTNDQPGQRGGPVRGTREESVTYVVRRAGQYELPAIELKWWNTTTSAVELAKVPAVRFDVAHAPGSAQDQLAGSKHGRHRFSPAVRLGGLIGGAVLVVVAGLLSWPASRRWLIEAWQSHRERRRQTEAAQFAELRRATIKASPAVVRERLAAWLSAASGAALTPQSLCRDLPPSLQSSPAIATLAIEVERLDRSLFARDRVPFGPPERDALRTSCLNARSELRQFRRRPNELMGLSPLNPST